MNICVIGAGVIGCSTAYELIRNGHQVTLLEANEGPGLETSFANGAQLSYSYVEPFANPATFWSLPKLFLGRQSPVRFRLRMDSAQWAWGVRFLRACTAASAASGTRQLLELAGLSRDVLEEWMRGENLSFSFRRNGKLVLCPDAEAMSRQSAQVQLQAYTGTEQLVLDRDECLAREPALANYTDFVGGIWTPTECVGDPHAYCNALTSRFLELGGHAQFGTKAHRFVFSNGSVRSLTTNKGQIDADVFVLCSGVQTPVLGRQLGEQLPIYPIKGYSVTLKMKSGITLPTTSVTDLGKKMVLARLGENLRVAAMAEVVGDDLSIPAARLERILEAVEQIYPGVCDRADVSPWAGLRPATPNSVPVIRTSEVPNVILNVGHGALGFTLAAGSARLVGALIARRTHEAVLPRFSKFTQYIQAQE